MRHPNNKSESRSVVPNSLRRHVAKFHSSWNSPGQNTGVGSCSRLQGIFPNQGLNPSLPHCRQIPYQLSHQGSPPNNKQDKNTIQSAARITTSFSPASEGKKTLPPTRGTSHILHEAYTNHWTKLTRAETKRKYLTLKTGKKRPQTQ